MGGGSNCLCVSLCPWEKGKHINKFPSKSQENARTVPGQSQHNPWTIPSKFCLCVFLFIGFFLALLEPLRVHPNFARDLGRQVLENTFPGLIRCFVLQLTRQLPQRAPQRRSLRHLHRESESLQHPTHLRRRQIRLLKCAMCSEILDPAAP